MKTVFHYISIVLLFLMTSLSAQEPDKAIYLNPINSHATAEQLAKSAQIIQARLKSCEINSSVILLQEKNQIKVQIPGTALTAEIRSLLTSDGSLGFYEVLTEKEIGDLRKDLSGADPYKADLLVVPSENQHLADSVEEVLKSLNLTSAYKLIWSVKNSKSKTHLYAVKKIPILKKTDIEDIKSMKEGISQPIIIQIKFRADASAIWAEATRRNIGKPIAIVIDDKVYFDPVVRTVIDKGLCEISGNFTQMEVNYLLALIGTESLPLKLIAE